MGVVAISETEGSLGAEVGQALAQALGYEFAGREIIARAAERFGENVLELQHAAEEKPTLWERFTDTQRRYVTYIEATMFELAARDNVVLVGRASTLVLRSMAHAVRVRVIAPERLRAARIEQQMGLTHEAAERVVRETDHEHAARVKFLYRVEWGDPLLYDLVLNTDRVSVDRAVRLIRDTLEGERFQATPASRRLILDLSLGAQAKAALLANPMTRSDGIYVSCTDATIVLSGSTRSEEERKAAQTTVAGIAGVAGVQNDIVIVSRSPVAGI